MEEKGREKKAVRECCSCVYWQRDGSDGICRAHAPRPETLAANASFTVYWPRSKAEDWCGEGQGVDA